MSKRLEWAAASDLEATWYSQEDATNPDGECIDPMGDTPPDGVVVLVTTDGNGLAILGSPQTVAGELRRIAERLDTIPAE